MISLTKVEIDNCFKIMEDECLSPRSYSASSRVSEEDLIKNEELSK